MRCRRHTQLPLRHNTAHKHVQTEPHFGPPLHGVALTLEPLTCTHFITQSRCRSARSPRQLHSNRSADPLMNSSCCSGEAASKKGAG